LAHWLLKMEQQRYASAAEESLRALQTQLRHIHWPA
jgi:hypothetical protein